MRQHQHRPAGLVEQRVEVGGSDASGIRIAPRDDQVARRALATPSSALSPEKLSRERHSNVSRPGGPLAENRFEPVARSAFTRRRLRRNSTSGKPIAEP